MFNPSAGSNQVVVPAGASASVSVNAAAQAVRIVNAGLNVAHVRIGAGVQTATTADTPVYPGDSVILRKADGADTLAHISALGTTLHVQTGNWGV